MFKDGQKIVLFSVLGGMLTWLVDAAIDSLAFGKGGFWRVLATDDAHELYMRSLFMVNFIIFGVLISLFMERRKRLENARTAAEKALHENEDRLQSVMESIGDSIYLIDSEYRYLYMNKKHIERLGLDEADLMGRAYRDLHSFEETEEMAEHVDRVLETGNTIRTEHFSRRDNKYFLRTISPVRNSAGKIIAATVVSKDVNDLKQMEEKLRNLSLTDELTGLNNRRGFFTLADPLLKLAHRQKNSVHLLYLDLDNLKEINDGLGHQEGDRAIMDAARALKETFRGSDLIARMGGDEFVVIPISGNKEDVDMVIARFRERIAAHNNKGDRVYKLSISIGKSCFDPAKPRTTDELMKEAEKMMYEEKLAKQEKMQRRYGATTL